MDPLVVLFVHLFICFSSIKAEGIYLRLLKGQILLLSYARNTITMPRRYLYLAEHIDDSC
jgi:hypothetical protein